MSVAVNRERGLRDLKRSGDQRERGDNQSQQAAPYNTRLVPLFTYSSCVKQHLQNKQINDGSLIQTLAVQILLINATCVWYLELHNYLSMWHTDLFLTAVCRLGALQILSLG